MSSDIYQGSIDQGIEQNFKDSFYELAQQSKSKLVEAGAITFLASSGKTNHMSRIGRLELTEVNTRNPDKQYGDYALDNRQFSKRRFTKTIQIDKKDDINELLADPTSQLLQQLDRAKERVIDRVAMAAAIGPVLVGAATAAPSSLSAANDGVLTISATSGIVYATIQSITQNYINNDIEMSDFTGSLICLTGKENTNLMSEDKFINNDYISGEIVQQGIARSAGTYKVQLFAGSVNGGITVTSPIIGEGATERSCPVLAPGAIAMSMEIGKIGVLPSPTKVNSLDITIDVWLNAMRTEGPLVQILTTTI